VTAQPYLFDPEAFDRQARAQELRCRYCGAKVSAADILQHGAICEKMPAARREKYRRALRSFAAHPEKALGALLADLDRNLDAYVAAGIVTPIRGENG
jgi:hypothetical protein